MTKKLVTVTTWRFRGLSFLLAGSVLIATHTALLTAIGASLIHHGPPLSAVDVLVLDNVEEDYEVFATGADLVRSGYASRALISAWLVEGTSSPGEVDQGVIDVMSRVAGIGRYEVLPVRQMEPISLNVASQIADSLEKMRIASVIVVSGKYRSARSCLVYSRVFRQRGIQLQCYAATGGVAPSDWWHAWHGVQDIGLETLKLLYYRLWVLPSSGI